MTKKDTRENLIKTLARDITADLDCGSSSCLFAKIKDGQRTNSMCTCNIPLSKMGKLRFLLKECMLLEDKE